ncbi:MAG: hypothetical protein KAI17_06480 [Thiotrichaceae bacterium]|nr:hypothetical protein [Thiotrichaceae bacterium]
MTTIGFSQQIKRAWLDFMVQRKLEGLPTAKIRASVDEFLSDKISVGNTSRRNSRQKAISILSKIWLKVPKSHESFRDEGLALFEHLHENSYIVLHWGTAMAAYPFFAIVAENVGRLLRLQNEVSVTQLQKRLREKMGERETVARAARQVMRSWADWGLLKETGKKGVYAAPDLHSVNDARLTSWLLESALIASDGETAVLDHLVNYTPALFPFNLSKGYFIPNERLETFSQGVSEVSVTFNHYHQNQDSPIKTKATGIIKSSGY